MLWNRKTPFIYHFSFLLMSACMFSLLSLLIIQWGLKDIFVLFPLLWGNRCNFLTDRFVFYLIFSLKSLSGTYQKPQMQSFSYFSLDPLIYYWFVIHRIFVWCWQGIEIDITNAFLLFYHTGPGLFWAVKDLPRCLAGVCRSSSPEDLQVIKTKFAWLSEFKFLWTWQDLNLPVFGECFIKTFYDLCFGNHLV